MNKSELFKAAHKLARLTVRSGDSYKVTFGACLKYVSVFGNHTPKWLVVEKALNELGGVVYSSLDTDLFREADEEDCPEEFWTVRKELVAPLKVICGVVFARSGGYFYPMAKWRHVNNLPLIKKLAGREASLLDLHGDFEQWVAEEVDWAGEPRPIW